MSAAFSFAPASPHGGVSLFASAFSMTAEETQALFALLCRDGNFYLCEKEGDATGCFWLLPMQGGAYLYGLATAPRFRGQGCMKAALAYAKETARVQGLSFIALIPATEELARTYRKYGFCRSFPLLASPDGTAGYLSAERRKDERPFSGAFASLYELSNKTQPLSLFCAAMESVKENADVWQAGNRFFVREKKNPTRVLTADRETLSALRGLDGGLYLPIANTSFPAPIDLLPR